ncbi:hypothetical protein AMTRI_Chr02g255990 [Amborella trichopoda]|uniref:Uncharacterized protein n=1 Tax=Amborella trichopoda TaxID=13333 RepID=U5CY57_AMBTC|nr:fe(2+) transport protein 1 [Amborella trichopoda]ERN14915.1 hypothetical protein AMTR_s00032p00184330 [Amborella trichopoda]|eukprot:XP_006853448.1 fe(2+) transport protein 1 [Amborella trichopoda]
MGLRLSEPKLCVLVFFLAFSSFLVQTLGSGECERETGDCYNKTSALRLKLVAIAAILISSMIGVCLPLITRSLPALNPDRDAFYVVKAFAAGVILATGYMHVLPDSFNNLTSSCLPENPWQKFPFTTFIAMLSAVFTLMVESFATSFYRRMNDKKKGIVNPLGTDTEMSPIGHSHGHGFELKDDPATALLRYRVIAQVLELGIVVHSVVIGLSLGASMNPCTIRPLVAALCFHQLFEGMGLGGSILQAEYKILTKSIMVFFFSVTTPFGIALGIFLSNVYSENSPTALIVVGVLNAASAGLLNYMALVDLLATDFMGSRFQNSPKLQAIAYAAVLLGAGGMSIMAKWA